MRKKLSLILLCIVMLTACGKTSTLTLPFAVSDVTAVELYQFSEGEKSIEKSIIDEGTIANLYNSFTDTEIKNSKSIDADSYVVFNFILTNDENYEIVFFEHAVKDGTLKVSDENYYSVSCDFKGMWNNYMKEATERIK